MSVIHKQTLEMTAVQKLTMPRGAEILSVREQGESICVWYRFEPEVTDQHAPISSTVYTEHRWIVIAGTGHECPPASKSKFLGTCMSLAGRFVWHIFELTDTK